MSEIRVPEWTKGNWDLTGTADNDVLYGGKGDNHFDGGAGDDLIHPGYAGANFIDGGTGVDTVVLGTTGFSHWQIDFDAASGTYKAGDFTLKNVEYVEFGDVRMKIEDAANHAGTQHRYTEGDDQIVGNDYGYALGGAGGNDTLIGNGGADTLYGGKGEDTAVFRGNRADYDIVFNHETGMFIVTDHQAGRDGADQVHGIENLKFADTTIHFDFTNDLSNTPSDADLAQVDGTIGTPYVPPPLSDDPAIGGIAIIDDMVWDGQWDDGGWWDIVDDSGAISAISAVLVANDAGAQHIGLAGVPAFEAASAICFVPDAP